ncbi:hypothetical protein [Nocardia stercoris]|uniref:ESX-1 secretion-associated protein n=1 Tax=Nocardia stercoris TaxID=2483361 RepID=A0A3M2LC28_9NOCA|nr:hypothetical protein [Nocardia stercoris]RMI35077.1 hypothetical protein EBN03_01755 [Nocardia stercoris]
MVDDGGDATDIDAGGEVAAVLQAVDDGRLWMNGVLVRDGTPERCATSYETLADQIDQQIDVLAAALNVTGFGGVAAGGFASGDDLRRGFAKKAGDALQLLNDYSVAARKLAFALRLAAKAYAQHDDEMAGALGRAGNDGPHA